MDISAIRERNFRLLVDERSARGVNKTTAARQFGMSPSYLSQLYGGKKLGDDTARNLETALRLPRGWMDRPQWGESQSSGLDLGKLAITTKFLEDLFDARHKVFIASEQVPMITAVYAELLTSTTPNLIEMGMRFGKQLDGDNERQGNAGSAGEDDRGATAQRTGKTKAAAGRKK